MTTPWRLILLPVFFAGAYARRKYNRSNAWLLFLRDVADSPYSWRHSVVKNDEVVGVMVWRRGCRGDVCYGVLSALERLWVDGCITDSVVRGWWGGNDSFHYSVQAINACTCLHAGGATKPPISCLLARQRHSLFYHTPMGGTPLHTKARTNKLRRALHCAPGRARVPSPSAHTSAWRRRGAAGDTTSRRRV